MPVVTPVAASIETVKAVPCCVPLRAAIGGSCFEGVVWLFGSWFGQLVLFGYTYVLFHHMFGGIRHFIWDFTKMMDPAGRELAVRLQLGAAVLLTLIVWASFVWFK